VQFCADANHREVRARFKEKLRGRAAQRPIGASFSTAFTFAAVHSRRSQINSSVTLLWLSQET
jgi:hypothetical protein